jgi:hydroxyacylglutathione hydrolase
LNEKIGYWKAQVGDLSSDEMPYMTLGQERQYNPFLRLKSPYLLAQLQGDNERETFKALRAQRDTW